MRMIFTTTQSGFSLLLTTSLYGFILYYPYHISCAVIGWPEMAHITFIESYNGVPPPTTGLCSCITSAVLLRRQERPLLGACFYSYLRSILTAGMPRSFFIALNYELREICLGISILIYIFSRIATGEASAASVYNIRRLFLPTVHSYGGDARSFLSL